MSEISPRPIADSPLSEPGAPEGLIGEAPSEVQVDALVAVPGGAAAEEPDEAVRKRLGIGFWIALGWVVVIIALAVLAPVLPIADPEQVAHGPRLSPPTAHNWLGTDNIGRDLLSRTIWGARISLIVGFASIFFGFIVGGTLGVIAGFRRGRLERVIMWAVDVLLSFPALVLALGVVAALGQTLPAVVFAIGIVSISPIARLGRANTLVWSEREFVQASRTLGAKNGRIIVREILPNVVIPMSALALLGVAIAIVAEGGLAFLALSVEGSISWGTMISTGRDVIQSSPLPSFVPSAAMFLTVLALNFAGDRLRAFLDVKEGAL